jgi:hypothetical protein
MSGGAGGRHIGGGIENGTGVERAGAGYRFELLYCHSGTARCTAIDDGLTASGDGERRSGCRGYGVTAIATDDLVAKLWDTDAVRIWRRRGVCVEVICKFRVEYVRITAAH